MYFVDKQNVALFEIGELGRQISGFGEYRAGSRAEIHAQFSRHDLGERGFSQSRRADEQNMVERLAPCAGRFDEDAEILARRLLPGEIDKRQRAQRRLVVVALFGVEQFAGRSGHGRDLSGAGKPALA